MSRSKCCTLTDQSYQYEAPGAPLHGGRIFERKIQACRNVFLSSLNQFLVIKFGFSTILDMKVPEFDNKVDEIPTENFQHDYDMERHPFEEEIKTCKDLGGP